MRTLSNPESQHTGVELEAEMAVCPRLVMGYQWQHDPFRIHQRQRAVPRQPGDVRTALRRAGSSVNGVIDTRYGALMPRLAVNLVGPHYFDGDNQLRQRHLRHPGQQHWLAGDGTG